MKHQLTPLHYALDGLEPNISKKTLEYHHGKHHMAYVNNLNSLIENSEFENSSLEEIICKSEGAIFNNAAQVWNHTFYFDQFSVVPRVIPQGDLLEAIEVSFGSFGSFKEQFATAALKLFGSGWVWLVKDGKSELMIVPASNAANPLREGRTPLMTLDVWEHAYYIDRYNNRAAYIAAFWDSLDWNVIERRYDLTL